MPPAGFRLKPEATPTSEEWLPPSGGSLEALLKCVTGFRVPAVHPALEPLDALLRGAVREALGRHASALHPLQAIVADGGGRVEAFLRVVRIELHPPAALVGVIAPDPCITIRLELHPHRERIARVRIRALQLTDLALG